MTFARLFTCALLVFGAGIFAPAVLAQEAGGGGRGMVPLPIPSPRPMPPPGWTCIWVAPVYQNITERSWVPEAVQMVSEWREIAPGRYEQVWRQIVIPGHWVTTMRRVLVSDGHWELVRLDPPPMPPMPPVRPPVIVVRNPGTVGVSGYGSGPVEDLSKFTPLAEWPK